MMLFLGLHYLKAGRIKRLCFMWIKLKTSAAMLRFLQKYLSLKILYTELAIGF